MTEVEGSVSLAAAPEGAVEGDLIGESVCGAIHALRDRGASKKRVARELGLDVKTVRKWWRRPWSVPRRRGRGKLLAPWEAFLKARAPEVGFNASVLHRELVDQGVEVSYWAVAKYVAPWRASWRPEEEPTVRFETGPGEQAQVDWGTTWAYFGEERVRVHVFTMVLGYNSLGFLVAIEVEQDRHGTYDGEDVEERLLVGVQQPSCSLEITECRGGTLDLMADRSALDQHPRQALTVSHLLIDQHRLVEERHRLRVARLVPA